MGGIWYTLLTMPIDPRELDPHATPDPYEGDWPCRKCGYNLKGLQRGSRCPECGFAPPQRASVLSARDNLLYAPLGYLKLLRLGALLMALGVVGAVLQVGLGFFVSEAIVTAMRLLIGAGWLGGVWIFTAPRQVNERTPVNPQQEWKRLRWVNRGTQACWLLGSLVATSAGAAGAPGALEIVAGLLGVVALFGLAPLAVQIADIAEWGADTGLASRLRGAAWGVIVFGVIIYLGFLGPVLPTALAIVLGIAMVVSWWLWVISMIVLGYSVLQLASMTHWAILNSHHLAARDERARQRQERDEHAAASGRYRDARGIALEREQAAGECPECGYDLQGLPPNAPCPECGHELSPMPIRKAPPEQKPAWLADDSPIELEPEKPKG